MKILEYRPNFGTLSLGFENFSKNEVVDVVNLSKEAFYGYNRIHKQFFPTSFDPIATYQPKTKVDLAILNPEFGENVAGRGASNFFYYDFQSCLDFLENNHPEFAIFQTETDVVPLINTAKEYVRDGFGQLSKDRLIYSLQKMGYKAYLLVIDEANYGIPLHRSFAFYVAGPEDFDFRFPKAFYNASGRGNFSKFRTVADAIGDLGVMGDWVPYGTDAQNVFQRRLRNEGGKVTWHHPPKIKEATKEKISLVVQGSNNETPKASARSRGYNRAKWDSICRCMDARFYLLSSRNGDSLHPIQNRPFSFREGCRIHGLPDKLSFDLKTNRAQLGTMIHNSVAPAIGELFAIALGCVE